MDDLADGSNARLVRALTLDGTIRALAVVAEAPARELKRRHGLGDRAARLAAEGLVSNLLLSAHVKGEERVLMEISSSEPGFTYSGEAWADGGVRGRFHPPDVPPVPRLKGSLAAIRWDARQEIYRGVAPLEHDRLELALEEYMLRSQQTRGLVRLRASADASFVGGVLLEMLPGALPDEFDAQAAAIRARDLPSLLAPLRSGEVGDRIEGLCTLPLEILEVRPLAFRCTCARDRVVGALLAMGAEEIDAIRESEGQAEAICHFCNERYVIDAQELAVLALQARARFHTPAEG